jgi:hypothetical protein
MTIVIMKMRSECNSGGCRGVESVGGRKFKVHYTHPNTGKEWRKEGG